MKILLSIYLLLMFLLISCNNEEKNKQAENDKDSQRIQNLFDKYRTEFQAQEILDEGFIFTQDYQKCFTNKNIIFKILSIPAYSKIEDIFNKNDTTYLQILCHTKNYHFEIICILNCPDSLIDYSSIKKIHEIIFVAHISEIHRITTNVKEPDNDEDNNSQDNENDITLDKAKATIVFSGQCLKIITVD